MAATTVERPVQGQVAVYDEPNAPFQLRMFPIRAPAPGEVLDKVRVCTICRSDILSDFGHRPDHDAATRFLT